MGAEVVPNVRARAEVVREVDAFMPHLRQLFSIWLPRVKKEEELEKLREKEEREKEREEEREEEREKEREKEREREGEREGKGGEGEEEDKGDGEEKGGDNDVESGEIDDIDGSKDDSRKEKKINVENVEKNENKGMDEKQKNQKNEILHLSPLQQFYKDQSTALTLLLVGRVSNISSLRFSAVDSIYICSAILKVSFFCCLLSIVSIIFCFFSFPPFSLSLLPSLSLFLFQPFIISICFTVFKVICCFCLFSGHETYLSLCPHPSPLSSSVLFPILLIVLLSRLCLR